MRLRYASRRDKKVSLRDFYQHRLMIRDETFSILHNSAKLFQQYVVDTYVKIESQELWWYQANQRQVRTTYYNRLIDYVRRRVAEAGPNARIGRITILPSGFNASCRGQNKLYPNAIAVVARHGKPELFITMTCNPHWPKITRNLSFNQRVENRSELVCRVFHTKLEQFMEDLVKQQFLGIVRTYNYSIEFQKRGLPHAHILIGFEPTDRIDDAEKMDRIPDREVEPDLYGVMRDYYVHRVCGQDNPADPCTNLGGHVCAKGYPKAFRRDTGLNFHRFDGRPEYARPDDGLFAGAGPDCITIQMRGQHNEVDWDEIRNYTDCRYISSMEACWRIFQYKLHDRSHAVVTLPVHLENERPVTFDEGDDEEELLTRVADATNYVSKLVAYFRLNAVESEARQLRYVEIPENYVWFHLRILLQHLRGATSFESIRTLADGYIGQTYHEACEKHRLLANFDIYRNAMREVCDRDLPPRRHRHEIPALWEEFKNPYIIADLIRRGIPRPIALRRALIHIDQIVAANREGINLNEIGLDDPEAARVNEANAFAEVRQCAPASDERENVLLRFGDRVCELNADQPERILSAGGARLMAVAWTGIAASLLIEGRTCPHAFRLPLDLDEESTDGWPAEHERSQNIRRTDVILWDEVSMTSKHALNAVCDVCENNVVPFGGKTNLRVHRAAQLAIEAAAHHPEMVDLEVAGNRIQEYGNWLLRMGDGLIERAILCDTFVTADLIKIDSHFVMPTIQELIEWVYDRVNENDVHYHSVDEYADNAATEDDEFHVSLDVVHRISASNIPPHELVLKTGAVVVLLKNLDVRHGQCKGTKMMIVHLGDDVLEVKFLSGPRKGETINLSKIEITSSVPQVPRPIKRDRPNLPSPCFAHGQLYVAFSRVGSSEDVCVVIENTANQAAFRRRDGVKLTRNVVHSNIFNNPEPLRQRLSWNPTRAIIGGQGEVVLPARTSPSPPTSNEPTSTSFEQDDDFFDSLDLTDIIMDVLRHRPTPRILLIPRQYDNVVVNPYNDRQLFERVSRDNIGDNHDIILS
ncbi:uncharacterized protein LOC132698088 [Cylas formicarius]|uniref:uncharacterized protein LOC132698088 n=1 Tax=Cylas formicarius TaxID=197179 RepID=UPI002958C36C|nr:uncharacterized protein LOC132698088 [Cylas formicarius]